MTLDRDLPDEFLPDKTQQIGSFGAPPCPGCGVPFDQGTYEYTAVEYDGETWHRGCAFAESDEIERADPPRRCPNCYAYSRWCSADTDEEASRRCPGCGIAYTGGEEVAP